MDTEIDDKLRKLETIQKGLSAKLLQLLRWGGLILSEIENTQKQLQFVEKELDGLLAMQDYSLEPYTKRGLSELAIPFNEGMKETILRALEQAGGNKAKAARILGITRRALLRKAQKYGVPNGEYYGPKRPKKGDKNDSSKDREGTENESRCMVTEGGISAVSDGCMD